MIIRRKSEKSKLPLTIFQITMQHKNQFPDNIIPHHSFGQCTTSPSKHSTLTNTQPPSQNRGIHPSSSSFLYHKPPPHSTFTREYQSGSCSDSATVHKSEEGKEKLCVSPTHSALPFLPAAINFPAATTTSSTVCHSQANQHPSRARAEGENFSSLVRKLSLLLR